MMGAIRRADTIAATIAGGTRTLKVRSIQNEAAKNKILDIRVAKSDNFASTARLQDHRLFGICGNDWCILPGATGWDGL